MRELLEVIGISITAFVLYILGIAITVFAALAPVLFIIYLAMKLFS